MTFSCHLQTVRDAASNVHALMGAKLVLSIQTGTDPPPAMAGDGLKAVAKATELLLEHMAVRAAAAARGAKRKTVKFLRRGARRSGQ